MQLRKADDESFRENKVAERDCLQPLSGPFLAFIMKTGLWQLSFYPTAKRFKLWWVHRWKAYYRHPRFQWQRLTLKLMLKTRYLRSVRRKKVYAKVPDRFFLSSEKAPLLRIQKCSKRAVNQYASGSSTVQKFSGNWYRGKCFQFAKGFNKRLVFATLQTGQLFAVCKWTIFTLPVLKILLPRLL